MATGFANNFLSKLNTEREQELATADSHLVAATISTHMKYRILALERMAKRLQRNLRETQQINMDNWRLDAREYIANQPGYLALQLLDNRAREIAILPPLAPGIAEEIIDKFDAQNTSNIVPGLERAARSNAVGIIKLDNGKHVLALAFPLFENDTLRNYLVAILDINEVIAYFMRSQFDRLPNVVVAEGEKTLFSHGTLNTRVSATAVIDNLVSFGRLQWRVTVAKNSSIANTFAQQLTIARLFGAICSLLLAGLVFFLMQNYRRLHNELRNERRIKDSEKFSRLIMDHTPDLIFVKDATFKIRQMNRAMLELYPNKVLEDIIGTTTIEDYDEKEAEEFLRYDRMALLEGFSETEESILFPSGERHVLLTQKIRFYDEAGDAFILGVSRNITAIKRFEESLRISEERYKLAVDGTSVGIWDIDFIKGEVFWSNRFREILGITDPNLTASEDELKRRLHKDDRAYALAAMDDHLNARKPYNIEYRLLHEDGSYVWVNSRGQASWNELGAPVRMVGSIDDISAMKMAVKELMRSNQELDDFAYIASHDLKEPLRGIHNHVRFLDEDYRDVLGEDGQHRVDRLLFLTRRLETLISDLLAYSRLSRTEAKTTAVNLNQVIADISNSLELGNATISIPDKLPTLECSSVQITELFRNLITNGLKYNESVDKKIQVDFQTDGPAMSSANIRYSVSDNGIGIPAQFRDDVFKIFKRLHGQDEYGGGTGSGLTFAKKIVEKYNGDIWIEDNEPAGTRICFTLPNARIVRNNQEHF